MRLRTLLLLLALAPAAHAQSSGTVALSGPSTGGSVITPATINVAVNAALATKADATSPTISGTQTNLGQIDLGRVAVPSAPASGGAFYVDNSNVLHFLNGNDDFPLGGACYNSSCGGNGGPHWWIGNYAVGEPSAKANEYATFRVQKNVTDDTAYGGIENGLTSSISVPGSKGAKLNLLQAASASATTIVVQDNAVALVAGAPLYAAGLANGTTVASVQHGVPTTGQATVTLSTPTATAMYLSANGATTQVGVGTTAATENEWNTFTCDTWQTAAGNCVAGFFGANKWAVGKTIPFSADFVSSDHTGLSSSHSGSGVTLEVDANASGPDDATWFAPGIATSAVGVRKGIHIVATSLGPSVDGPGVIANGVVAMVAGVAYANEPTTLTNGFNVLSVPNWGNVTNAFASDGSGAGQVGLNLSAGYMGVKPTSQAASGANQIVFGKVPVTVGQLVSDASGCVPAGTTVGAAQEGFSFANTTVTLSANLTCDVATSDQVTFTNKFADGLLFTGTYTDALANLTNAGATGVLKLGSTLTNGTVGQIQLRGNNTAVGVIQATIDGGGNGSLMLSATGGNPSVIALSPFRIAQYTVATLPACNSTTKGAFAGVTDAISPTYNGALTGGGSVAIPVYCNGSAWTAH